MGGIKSDSCSKIASNVWDFCITDKLWISTAHIPGISIKEPKKLLRTLEDPTDWQLNSELFKEYCIEKSVKYDIDLFICVSINNFGKYVSWYPTAGAAAVDAFLLTWILVLPI